MATENSAPRSLRLRIAFCGRVNAGKSSLVNLIADQDVSIVSPEPGTTTDAVTKAMELRPLGPVTLVDTAGLDDGSALGPRRAERALRAIESCDLAVLVAPPGDWGPTEEAIASAAARRGTPLMIVVNKVDDEAAERIADGSARAGVPSLRCSCVRARTDPGYREAIMAGFKKAVVELCPEGAFAPQAILADLLPVGDEPALLVLVAPIDGETPRGRLIMPQVQSIRDALDARAITVVVQDDEYPKALAALSRAPDLVVCDSQVIGAVHRDTPPGVALTTFSILFSRVKGDMGALAAGCATLSALSPGDRVLVAEACTHHPSFDDIGRVKLPRWIREHAGSAIDIDHSAGGDYPADLGGYRLVVHCGACTLTRKEGIVRIERAREAGVAITNYGMAISLMHGALERALEPFPSALAAYRDAALRDAALRDAAGDRAATL